MKFSHWSNGIRHSKKFHSHLNPLLQKDCTNTAGETNDEEKNVANCDQPLATQNEDDATPCEAVSCAATNTMNGDSCVDLVEHNTSFACHTCTFFGENDNELVNHVFTSHISNPEEIEISFIDNWLGEMETDQVQIFDNQFKCDECEFETSNVEEYVQHNRTRHIPNLTCPCGVSCEGYEGLIVHMQTVHITVHSCPLCKIDIIGYCNLETHIKEKH